MRGHMTYSIQEAMNQISLFVVTQTIVESSTVDIRSSHLKPVMTMLTVGEAGWPNIMFKCFL